MDPARRYDWPLILAYHSVSEGRRDSLAVRLDDFERQIAWLRRRGYRSMTLADLHSGRAQESGPPLVITFDDGYADNYTLALPVLKRHGFVATVFVVSEYVGTDRVFPWDLPKLTGSPDRALYKVLGWDQIHEMVGSGFEIGSHTCTHPHELTALFEDQRWDEVARSRSDLQTKLGREVVSFCYPRGSLDLDAVRMVEKAGYTCGVVTPSRWGLPLTRYTLRRIGVYQSNTPLVFRVKTTRLVRRNYERLLWLRGRRS
jgi:peptidoglycan/xylan/chitin deacetylase (PgdA/CDA1 family)